MKKMNNKGFSLVELIIVIAIMAILAGAIAPALIRYIDKSRKSNDVSAAKTIKTAVETAMANETTYEILTTGTSATKADVDGNTIKYSGAVKVATGIATSGNGGGVTITLSGSSSVATANADAITEIGKNIGEKTPKIKYKKAADDTHKPTCFYVLCSDGGTVVVGLADDSLSFFYQLAPDLSKYYQ